MCVLYSIIRSTNLEPIYPRVRQFSWDLGGTAVLPAVDLDLDRGWAHPLI